MSSGETSGDPSLTLIWDVVQDLPEIRIQDLPETRTSAVPFRIFVEPASHLRGPLPEGKYFRDVPLRVVDLEQTFGPHRALLHYRLPQVISTRGSAQWQFIRSSFMPPVFVARPPSFLDRGFGSQRVVARPLSF